MPRNTKPGSLHDMIRRAVAAAGGVEAVAADMDCGIAKVSGWSDPEVEGGRRMSAADLARLARLHPGAAAPEAAEFFAALAGGAFTPPAGGRVASLERICGRLAAEVGATVDRIMHMRDPDSDGGAEITAAELVEARAALAAVEAQVRAARAALQDAAGPVVIQMKHDRPGSPLGPGVAAGGGRPAAGGCGGSGGAAAPD